MAVGQQSDRYSEIMGISKPVNLKIPSLSGVILSAFTTLRLHDVVIGRKAASVHGNHLVISLGKITS